MPVALTFESFYALGIKKLYKLIILKIKDLKTTNKDHKKGTKQGSRYCSVESVEYLIYMTEILFSWH